MINEKKLTKLIIIIPIFFILLTIFSALYLSITLLNNHFKDDVKIAEQQELQLQKQYIKSQVDGLYNYIEHKKLESIQRLKEDLKEKVYSATQLMQNLYDDNKDKLSEKELQTLILDTISKIRYGKDGYFFIHHLKSEHEVISKMFPSIPHKVDVNMIDIKDIDGKYIIRSFVKAIKENKNKEGFVDYKWIKLSTKKHFKKISFVKQFEPYNWLIGFGEYYDVFEENIKLEAIKRMNLFKYGNNGYIYTMDTNHVLIQHPYREDLIGKNHKELKDKKGKKFIHEIVTKAITNKEGGFIEYYWNKPNREEDIKKIAFFKLVPNWDWIIITGIYNEDVKFSIDSLKKKKEEDIGEVTYKSVVFSLIILVLVSILAFLVSRKINSSFLSYKERLDKHQKELEHINLTLEHKVDEKTTELRVLNEKLEEKIEQRIEELKDRDRTLAQQSKMVALGEMIGNIAHQWRQPLSAISTAASGLKLKKEMDILSDEELMEFSDGIVKNANYLSQVIEDFKNYIKGEKHKDSFDVKEALSNALNIFDSSIVNHNIKIIKEFESDMFVNSYKNELVQALVNILNNAKDALKENIEDQEERVIKLTTKVIDEKVAIIIEDSAKGIPESIINKIFEPYFTTKANDQGTGLGLYMTYQIVVDSMKGILKVENSSFTYENKKYSGAKFTILLEKDYKKG